MKGVGRLIKNELIKIFGQLSWKIITVIVLVLSLLIPVLNIYMNNFVYSYDNYYREIYNQATDGSIEKEYYGAMADVEDFFTENGITYDDWRYEEYYVEFQDLYSSVKAYELVINGKSPNEVFEWFYSNNINYGIAEDGTDIIEYYDEDTGEFVPLTLDISEMEYEKNKAALDEMTDDILNGSIRSYAEDRVEVLKEQVKIYEEELSVSKAAYKADPDKLFDYQEDYFNLYACKAALTTWEVLVDASREDEMWLLNTAKNTFYYTEKGSQLATIDRESFETDPYLVQSYGDYEKYCEVMGKTYYDNIAAVDILRYSAENGKPLPEMCSESTRNTVSNAVMSNASIILFLCIILAATTVATEHMTGTVRLLVIRPRARWKILLSKLMAIVVYGLVTFAVASVLSVVITLIISGTGDLFVPMLIHRHGAVKEVSFAVYTIAKTAVTALPSLFILSMAFFLSVAVKKIVFAVAIPMLITMFGSLASSVSIMSLAKFSFLKWTLLPYFVMDSYTSDVVSRTLYNFGADFVSFGFELEIGAVLYLIHIAIFTALSFVVFKRQQIKN